MALSMSDLFGAGSLLGAFGSGYSNLASYSNAASNVTQLDDLAALQRVKDQWAAMQQMQAMQLLQIEPVKKLLPVKLPEEELVCATGGLIGWRTWNVTAFGSTLKSFNGVEWKPFTKLTAECKGCSDDCTCGIYAWKLDAVSGKPPDFNALKSVCGEVWLWGRVLECEHGYRAEFAYPKAFVNTGLLAKRMAGLYRVSLLEEK